MAGVGDAILAAGEKRGSAVAVLGRGEKIKHRVPGAKGKVLPRRTRPLTPPPPGGRYGEP